MTIQNPVRPSVAPRIAAAALFVVATVAVALFSESAHLLVTIPVAAAAGWTLVRPRPRRIDPVAVRRLEELAGPRRSAAHAEGMRHRKAS